VKFERKHAWVLIAVAVWNVVIWTRFIKVLVTSDETDKWFYIAHSVLIVGNFAIAALFVRWGWQALKADKAVDSTVDSAGEPVETR
jgi:hypothetical protein